MTNPTDSNSSLEVAIRTFPFAINTRHNCWGDYDRIIAIFSRKSDQTPDGKPGLRNYFKVHKLTGGLFPITYEELCEVCVDQCVFGSDSFELLNTRRVKTSEA